MDKIKRGKLQITMTFIWFKTVCLLVSVVMTGESKQRPGPRGEGSPGKVMEFTSKHVENTQMRHGVQGRNSATTTVCHELVGFFEEFV